MLDLISAVGVAAATVQFLDFARKIFLIGQEAYSSVHGSTADTIHLVEVHSHLGELSRGISRSLSANASTSADKVVGIANSCQRDCELLLATLAKVQTKSGQKSVYKSLEHALLVVWKRKTIVTIEARLDRYRRELTLAIVATLSDGQSALARGLQTLVADTRQLELSQKPQIDKIEELFQDIKLHRAKESRYKLTELEENRERREKEDRERLQRQKEQIVQGHIGSGTQNRVEGDAEIRIKAQQSLEDSLLVISLKSTEVIREALNLVRYQRLLRSLYFPQIKVRHSRIEVAHERTFKWLFQEPKRRSQSHDSKQRFAKWLRSGEGIFWISGKPGSGKSTLMKWLAAQERTKRALEEWANPTLAESRHQKKKILAQQSSDAKVDQSILVSFDDVKPVGSRNANDEELEPEVRAVTACFYFWSAGTSMQKSQEGLFQSLLYEIFTNAPDLMQYACPNRWHATQLGEFQEPWTMTEISETITRAINATTGKIKFCFFVDGVDEYSGDHLSMIKLLQDFSHLPGVKLCVSSRPWNVFEDAFGQESKKKFYLQDLTKGDIKHYVQSKLTAHPAWKELATTSSEYALIATEIQNRADGVFLWVFLVVRSLLDGLTNGDTITILKDRLARIPGNLQEFFKLMLHSLDPIYNAHIALFFLAAMDSPDALPLTTFAFFEAEFENNRYVYELDCTAFELYHIISVHKQTERRLNGRCKGLVESYRDSDGVDIFRYRVGFLHRTVRDYFLTAEMRTEFESSLPDNLQVCLCMVKACIAMMKKMPRVGVRSDTSAAFQYLVDLAFHNLRRAEMLNGELQDRLVVELSDVLHRLEYLDDHWGSRRGDPEDMFLGLAIQRGLTIYVSQQLRYWTPKAVASKRLKLGLKNLSLLSCALSIDSSVTDEKAKLSDIVLLLLKKGSDANERVQGKTLLAQYLEFLASDDTFQKPSPDLEHTRILKTLLVHGADPNETESIRGGDAEWPVWMIFAKKVFKQAMPEVMLAFYLELIELCLLFRADPNLGHVPSTCKTFEPHTPFENFLTWVHTQDSLKTSSLHRQEAMARLFIALLNHGADTRVRIHCKDDSGCQSVSDIIGKSFRPSLAGKILATLPPDSTNCIAPLEEEPALRPKQEPRSYFAWIGALNPLRLFGGHAEIVEKDVLKDDTGEHKEMSGETVMKASHVLFSDPCQKRLNDGR